MKRSFEQMVREYSYQPGNVYVEPAVEGASPLLGPFFHGYLATPQPTVTASTVQYGSPFIPVRYDYYNQEMQRLHALSVAGQAPTQNIYSGFNQQGIRYTYGT